MIQSVRRLPVLLAALLLARSATAEQRRQLLAKVDSSLGASDWLDGGSCGDATAADGCRRQVVAARAVALGRPFEEDFCGVKLASVGDGGKMEDVTDGTTLGVLHTCVSEGEVLPQVSRACLALGFGRVVVGIY